MLLFKSKHGKSVPESLFKYGNLPNISWWTPHVTQGQQLPSYYSISAFFELHL